MAIFRIKPNMPVGAYTTYSLTMPKDTHWRKATCEEVECQPWRNGWKTIVPTASPQADYIRAKQHGRHFTEAPADGGMAEFTFPPGQPCFRSGEHRLQLQRPPIASLRGGDWRAATTPVKVVNLQEWVNRFGENQVALKDRVERG